MTQDALGWKVQIRMAMVMMREIMQQREALICCGIVTGTQQATAPWSESGKQRWVVGEVRALFLSRAHTDSREGEDLEARLRSGQSSLPRRLHAAKIQRPAYAHQRESLAKFTKPVSTLFHCLSYGGACQKVPKLPCHA